MDNFKITYSGKEIDLDKASDELNPDDKIEYVHRVTMSVVKNSNADKTFKKYYKSKQKASHFKMGKMELPLNLTDHIKINVSEMIKSDGYNTYVLSIITYAGSDTYNYINSLINTI